MQANEPTARLLSVREMSAQLGISPNALRYHVRMGRIPAISLGRKLLFDASDVLKRLKR